VRCVVQIVSHHTLSFRAYSVCLAELITSCAVLEPELCIPGVWAGERLAVAAALLLLLFLKTVSLFLIAHQERALRSRQPD
jgi:hypothetical protein